MKRPTRRSFLKGFAPSLGGMLYVAHHLPGPAFNSQLSQQNIEQFRGKLLDMINEERSLARVSPVSLDDFASRIATEHANDMAKGKFTSHWGSDGRKPYQRYSFAGGIHGTAENISSADNTWSWKPTDISQDVSYLHVRLYSEVPPNDGHRKAILAPHQTHVGIGIAVQELRLRLVELFVAKFLEIDDIERKARPGASFDLRGRLFNLGFSLQLIEVFYEPLPRPPGNEWLNNTSGYSLPDESVRLRPKLAARMRYLDGVPGVVDWDGRNFLAPIKLFKEDTGIYTIVVWLRKDKWESAFPATHICIRAEK
jgi:uncharacterized protein YkwD